jgi:HK97 family phage portal protein
MSNWPPDMTQHVTPVATPGPEDDFWYGDVGQYVAGVKVTPDTALKVSAVYACVRVIAEAIASLPLIVYRRIPSGGKERATDHPLYKLLHDMPNKWQTSFEWREMSQSHLLLRGNSYNFIVDDRGTISDLVPIHPDRVQKIERLSNGLLRYTISGDNGVAEKYLQEEILHIRGLSSDGIKGLSPVELAAETIGTAMSVRSHGANTFKNGARPGVVLEHPGKLTPQAQTQLRNDWERVHAGPKNAARTAVLVDGMKAHEMGMTNQASQYIETEKLTVTDIARIFRVQPHLIGDLDRATFSNIEQQSIEFVVHTLRPWLVRWEQALSRDLFRDEPDIFAEFLVDGLLRGDAKARSEALQVQFQNGALSANEWREIENRNPVEGGDRYFVMSNLAPSDRVDDQIDAQTAPPEPPAAPASPPAAEVPLIEQMAAEPAKLQGVAPEAVKALFSVFIQDAAERISARLVRIFESRIDKADEDRDRFNAWLETFEAEQQQYAVKTLSPVVAAWVAYSGHDLDCAGLAGELWSVLDDSADPAVRLEKWKQSAASEMAAHLEDVLCTTD